MSLDNISGNNQEIKLSEFDNLKHYNYYKGLICGRGVVIFNHLFDNKTIKEDLKSIFSCISNLNYKINILEFMDIVENHTGINKKVFIEKYINQNNI